MTPTHEFSFLLSCCDLCSDVSVPVPLHWSDFVHGHAGITCLMIFVFGPSRIRWYHRRIKSILTIILSGQRDCRIATYSM
ncbi:hypothetical protein BDR03DRAFT_710052 [Suillus americanus]|nr:hypothetical protein BDR03DRAFT_710052 [Suillus americanus]